MKSLITFLILLALIPANIIAQNAADTASLDVQFETLKKKSNNYQNYEVVDRAMLEGFWSNIEDTIQSLETNITELNKELSGSIESVQSLEAQVTERDQKIEEQAGLIENMSVLGIQIGKGAYVTLSWIVLFALLATIAIIYFRFKNANKVTVSTRKEYTSLQEEFEAHRQRARENETKIKRDLQTEINRVQELKEKLGES